MSTEVSASPPNKREKRLWLAVILAVISVSLSGASFYRFERPRIVEKIVEKPVEKIVEKLVPQECPTGSPTGTKASPKGAGKPDARQPTYSVQNPTGSIVNQGSENYGTQTVNNTPPSRLMSPDAAARFKTVLSTSEHGSVHIVRASSSDDVGPLEDQIISLLTQSEWLKSYDESSDGMSPQADGLECYSDDWGNTTSKAFRAAMEAGGLKCKYLPRLYEFHSEKFFALTLVIGRNIRQP